MKRNDLSRSLVAFEQNSTLVAVVELSLKSWLVAGLVPGLARQPLKKQSAGAELLFYAASWPNSWFTAWMSAWVGRPASLPSRCTLKAEAARAKRKCSSQRLFGLSSQEYM
jgi:hypothetical protein